MRILYFFLAIHCLMLTGWPPGQKPAYLQNNEPQRPRRPSMTPAMIHSTICALERRDSRLDAQDHRNSLSSPHSRANSINAQSPIMTQQTNS